MHQTDDNGTLNFEEFSKLLEVIGEWKKIFNKVDVNRSGTIEKDELKEALKLGGGCDFYLGIISISHRLHYYSKHVEFNFYPVCQKVQVFEL